MKTLLLATAAAALLAAAHTANAAPITDGSTISLNGANSYSASSIDFSGPGNIGAASGDFAAAGISPCFGCAMFTDFDTSTGTPFTLYTATEGTLTTSLTINTDTFNFNPGPPLPSLSVSGEGTLELTGFDPTPGVYTVTTQGPNDDVIVTFSVTSMAQAVPEPASLALLGISLLGLGFIHRKRAV